MTADSATAVALLNGQDATASQLGLEVVSVADGHVVLAMTVAAGMTNGAGVAHGGWIFTLADTAFGYAATTRRPGTLTTDADIRFHRPASAGARLEAEARVVEESRSTLLVDVVVRDADGRRIASFRGAGRSPRVSP